MVEIKIQEMDGKWIRTQLEVDFIYYQFERKRYYLQVYFVGLFDFLLTE